MPAPAWAGSRTRLFDSLYSIYNPAGAGANGFRALMANVAAQRLRVTHIGDSESRSYPPGLPYGQASVATRTRIALAAKGVPVNTGMVVPADTSALRDWRWTWTSNTWVMNASSADGPFIFSSTPSAQATFVSDVAGTVVDILTYGNTAAFTVSIDGVSKGAIVPNGSANPQLISFTGLSNATHTVVITNPATGTSFVVGAGVRRATGGFEMTTMGQSGVQTNVWLPSYGGTFGLWSVMNTGITPEVVVVTLGANEALGGVALATFRKNQHELIDNIIGAGRIPILSSGAQIQPDYNGVTQAKWDEFMLAYYDLADFYDIPLIDVRHLLGGTWAAANTAGLMSDQVHPSVAGYQKVADSLAYLFGSQRPEARLLDRWDGTKLVRVREDRWNGTALVLPRSASDVNQPPSSGFRIAIVGLTLYVAALGTDPDTNSAVTFTWNFGDGSTATGANPSRTYASAGTRTVTCTATDAEGSISTSSRVITV